MELSQVLKKLRLSRGMSIAKLGEISGTGNGTVGNIERGANKTTPETLEKLAKALNLNAEEELELYKSSVPEKISEKIENLTKRDINQYNKTVNEASSFFRNESISEEDKKKMLDVITELFIDAKLKNKEKYKKK